MDEEKGSEMRRATVSGRPGRRGRAVVALTAVFALLLSTAALAAPPVQQGAPQGLDGRIVPDSYLVLLDDDHPSAVAREHARRHGITIDFVYGTALRGYAATIPGPSLRRIERDPRVRSVEPNLVVTAHGEATRIPTGVERIDATSYLADGDGEFASYPAGPAVAVLDTGIELGRSELNVVGRVDCMDVYEVRTGPPWQRGVFGQCVEGDDVADDDGGHGTHVAGTVGAYGALLGVAPALPLYAVKVLGPDGGSLAGVVAGIDWAAGQPDVGVINMSLGGQGSSQAMDDAVGGAAAAGIVTVTSAGNADADADGYTPANSPGAVTVGAIADYDGRPGGEADATCFLLDGTSCGDDDSRAVFSNWGDAVDIAAPGVSILSSVPIGLDEFDSGYATFSGTSMAAPHVAAAAALAMADAGARASGVLDHLLAEWTVEPDSPCGYTPTAGKPVGPLLLLTPCDDDPAPPPPSAELRISDVDVSPQPVEVGADATVTVSVVNAGDADAAAGDVEVTLSEDGALVAASGVGTTLGPGDSTSVELTWTAPATPGDRTLTAAVSLAGVTADTASVTVAVEDPTSPPPPDGITLDVAAYKFRGLQKADLTWSNATGQEVHVVRDGVTVLTVPNTGSATDDIDQRGSGAYTYEVCETDMGACSPAVTVSY